jgi:hypothetical protein
MLDHPRIGRPDKNRFPTANGTGLALTVENNLGLAVEMSHPVGTMARGDRLICQTGSFDVRQVPARDVD